jgi:hypothetical protein
MEKHFAPHIDIARLRFHLARMHAWALGLMLRLAEMLGAGRWARIECGAQIARMLCGARASAFLIACHGRTFAAPPSALPSANGRPRAPPCGFIYRSRRGSPVRFFTRALRLRGVTFAARLRALVKLLDNIGAVIARLRRRLDRPALAGRLVAVAPPAFVSADAFLMETRCVDTS